MADKIQFSVQATADKYECLLEKDQSVVVLNLKDKDGNPAPYRGKISKATPEACAQMIDDGIEFIKEKKTPAKATNVG